MPDFITRDDQLLHVSFTPGHSEKRAVVFSNSLGTDFRIWDGVLPLLPEGTPVLRLDKRGHGLSGMGPVTIQALADDTAFAMDHFGVSDAVVCGVSVGGLIAQALAGSRSDLTSALVLSNTGLKIGTDEIWNPRIETARNEGLEPMADATMERWFSPDFHANKAAEMAGYRTMLVRVSGEGYARVSEAIRDCDLTSLAASIAVPTTCVAGEFDGATTPALVKALADAIPGAVYDEIAGVGHLPCIEAPQRVAAAINAHLG